MKIHFSNVQSAVADWRRCRDDPENQWDAFEAAEAFILALSPRCPDDVAAMLDVLITQSGDPRSDGLDIRALRSVRDFISPEARAGR